jgi:hypothetical protein
MLYMGMNGDIFFEGLKGDNWGCFDLSDSILFFESDKNKHVNHYILL